jgi:hypothetical protein
LTNYYAEAANTIKRTVTVLSSSGTPVDCHSNAASWVVSLAAMASPANLLETHIKNIMNTHGSAAGLIASIPRGFFLEI